MLRLIRSLKEHQEYHDQPETAPKLNEKDTVKKLNTIIDYLCGYLCESMISLDYVVHDDPEVTPEAYDPYANHEKIEEEIIDRTPHTQGGIPYPTFAPEN